jgi:hypothetical protein
MASMFRRLAGGRDHVQVDPAAGEVPEATEHDHADWTGLGGPVGDGRRRH